MFDDNFNKSLFQKKKKKPSIGFDDNFMKTLFQKKKKKILYRF